MTEQESTGSISYQIDLLRQQIQNLQFHLSQNKTSKTKGNEKDVPAKRSLLKKVSKLKTLLLYLKKNNSNLYEIKSKKTKA